MAGVGGAPGRGQLGGHPRQQVGQGECLDTGQLDTSLVVRFDKEEAVVMDWHVDASIPLGEYSVQDLWSGEAVANITVGGEEWEGARWRGIVHSHDNYSFKLTPLPV